MATTESTPLSKREVKTARTLKYFFHANADLKQYAPRPVGTFHALPVARGKWFFKSHWIRDVGYFYGPNLFLAETSATTGGLDSRLEPQGNIKLACQKAARAFGAEHTYFSTCTITLEPQRT